MKRCNIEHNEQNEFSYPFALNGMLSKMEKNILNSTNIIHLLVCSCDDEEIILEIALHQKNKLDIRITSKNSMKEFVQTIHAYDMYTISLSVFSKLLWFRSTSKVNMSLVNCLHCDQVTINEACTTLKKINRNYRECINAQTYLDIIPYLATLTELMHCCDYSGLENFLFEQLRSVTFQLVKLCGGLILHTESDWWSYDPVTNREFYSWEQFLALYHEYSEQRIICVKKSMTIILEDLLINLRYSPTSLNLLFLIYQ